MRGRDGTRGGFVEYAGLMIIIAGIFTLIDGLGLDGLISGAILEPSPTSSEADFPESARTEVRRFPSTSG